MSLVILAGTEIWETAQEKKISSVKVPDLCELVMKKFVKRANNEIPDWPPMIVEEKRAEREYIHNFYKNKSGTLMVFQIVTTKAPGKIVPQIPRDVQLCEINTSDGLFSKVRWMIIDSEKKYSGRNYLNIVQRNMVEIEVSKSI